LYLEVTSLPSRFCGFSFLSGVGKQGIFFSFF